jgi:hypothetical protein
MPPIKIDRRHIKLDRLLSVTPNLYIIINRNLYKKIFPFFEMPPGCVYYCGINLLVLFCLLMSRKPCFGWGWFRG